MIHNLDLLPAEETEDSNEIIYFGNRGGSLPRLIYILNSSLIGYFAWRRSVVCTTGNNTKEVELISSPIRGNIRNPPSKEILDEGKEKGEEKWDFISLHLSNISFFRNNFLIFSVPCIEPELIEWDPTIGVDALPDESVNSEDSNGSGGIVSLSVNIVTFN